MKTRVALSILFILSISACQVKQEKDKSEEGSAYVVPEVVTLRSDYTIPEALSPVVTWKDGYGPGEARMYRQTYGPTSGVTADDAGAYGSSRLSEVLPTAVVHRSGEVSEILYEPVQEVGQVAATTILGTMTLEEMMHDPRSRMKAIAVVHDGKLVFEQYMGLREWDNHIWASASKILNGTLIHILEEEGLIDLNDPVTVYLPELEGTDWEAVTVADVLHQRSGLDISESRLNSALDHPVTLLYAILGGDESLPPGTSLLEAVKLAEKYMEPGEKFEYSSINTHVLTLILERILDQPIEDIITERIWSKAGMEGDAVLGLSASGEPMAFGIFASRLRDLARFGMLFTPSWTELSDEQIIPGDYHDKALTAAIPEVYGDDYMSKRLINDFEESDFGASYQWDAVFADGDMYKSGRTGQCLYVSPGTNTVVVWYSSAYMAEVWVHAYAREIVNTLFR